jgi:hypothetical protein
MIVAMTYRPPEPVRNILPCGFLLAAAVAVGCVGPGCAPEPPSTPSAGSPASKGAPNAAPRTAPIRFEPAKGDHSDLAVGETMVERIALVADASVDWNALELLTGCDCMSARFVDKTDARRAWVEVEYHGDKVEEVDGLLLARDGKKRDVARYEAPVVIRRKPFVQPRRVVLEAGGTPRFEIVIGQAFARGEKLPDFLLEEIKFSDDSKIAMVDAPTDETVQTPSDGTVVMLCRLPFEPNEAARARQGSVKITVRFGAPVVERVVEASWPGSH